MGAQKRRFARCAAPRLGAVCTAKIPCRHTSAGLLFTVLVKHYLFVRGLLPAPFESIEAQLGNLELQAANESSDDSVKRGRRTCNAALKRFIRQMSRIQQLLERLQQVSHSRSGPLNLLLLLGPSPTRPKEAVELTLPAWDDADEGWHDMTVSNGDAERLLAAKVQSANRKARAKLIQQVLPAVSTLPLPNLTGNVKMFVCVKAGDMPLHEDYVECRPDYQYSLKKCVTTVVNVKNGSTGGSLAASELETVLRRSAESADALMDENDAGEVDRRSWYLLRDVVKGLKNCDECHL